MFLTDQMQSLTVAVKFTFVERENGYGREKLAPMIEKPLATILVIDPSSRFQVIDEGDLDTDIVFTTGN